VLKLCPHPAQGQTHEQHAAGTFVRRTLRPHRLRNRDASADRGHDPRRIERAAGRPSKDKLAKSRAAAERGDKRGAAQFAEQAELDAELAAATARSENAQKAAAEVRASIETLRAEMARQAAR
jgi:hypothetical protein